MEKSKFQDYLFFIVTGLTSSSVAKSEDSTPLAIITTEKQTVGPVETLLGNIPQSFSHKLKVANQSNL